MLGPRVVLSHGIMATLHGSAIPVQGGKDRKQLPIPSIVLIPSHLAFAPLQVLSSSPPYACQFMHINEEA